MSRRTIRPPEKKKPEKIGGVRYLRSMEEEWEDLQAEHRAALDRALQEEKDRKLAKMIAEEIQRAASIAERVRRAQK